MNYYEIISIIVAVGLGIGIIVLGLDSMGYFRKKPNHK
jgi:hypothetical protein